MKHLPYFFISAFPVFFLWFVSASYAQIGVQWEKKAAEISPDFQVQNVIATADGNHLLVGFTPGGYQSVDDYQVVKIDEQGNKLWEKTYGGSGDDELYAAVATADGGYMLGGASKSPASGDKSEDSHGDFDYWVIKTDADGNIAWDKNFGGAQYDQLKRIVPSGDGGYLLAGTSNSGDSFDKSQGRKGEKDYWVVKIDALGNKLWDKTLGGNATEELIDVVVSGSGQYLLVGSSMSKISGDKSEPAIGPSIEAYWAILVDGQGNKIWDRTLGGPSVSIPGAAVATADGGYIIAGAYYPYSIRNPNSINYLFDHKIVKLDALGNVVWEVNRGGNFVDIPTDIIAAEDGGYLVVGRSDSYASGAKSEDFLGRFDLDGLGLNDEIPPFDTWIYKINSEGKKLWDKTLPGGEYVSVASAPNQSYVLAGNYIQNIHETDVSISGLRLVNAETGKDIGWLNDKDLLEQVVLGNPKLNIRAIPSPLKVDSVVFKLTGPVAHQSTEMSWPYTLFGDTNGDDGRKYLGKKLRPGNRYVLSVVPYLDGYAGAEKKIEFRVTQEFGITLEWVALPAGEGELTDGTELSTILFYTVAAHFSPENIPGVHVDFELTGPFNHTQTESESPYVLFGDFVDYKYEDVNYRSFPAGAYTLKATPYFYGEAGPETIVSFTVAEPEEANAARTSSVEVYPVPSTGILQLEHQGITEATLQVIDFTGNAVLTKPLGSQAAETLDLTSFKKGIYYVKVLNQQGVATKRIVIE